LNLVGCRGLIVIDRFKTSDYVSMLKQLMPEFFAAGKTQRKSEKVPSLEFLIMIGDQAKLEDGMCLF